MTGDDNPFPINEKEVMEYYGYSGRFGSLKLKTKFLRLAKKKGLIMKQLGSNSDVTFLLFFSMRDLI